MKHLVKLYPKRWRERYGAEIAALVGRSRVSLGGVFDLLRGALDAHLHAVTASPLVFVPTIGFRPRGTWTLLERAEATVDDTHLTVLAIAATPERTEVIVEWEQTKTPEACALPATMATAPSAELGAPPKGAPSGFGPTDVKLTAALVSPETTVGATSLVRHSFNSTGWSVRSMIFPALPHHIRSAELRVTDGEHEWRVPFALAPGHIDATPIAAEAERDGIAIRATAVTWQDDQLIVAMDATAARPIGRIGAPAPAMPIPPSGRKFKVMRGVGFEPIKLEDDRGTRGEEIRRLYPLRDRPELHVEGEPYVQRFDVFFGAPNPDARTAVIVVPFVEITELDHAVIADLREVPVDLELGGHPFRVVKAEPYPGSNARQIQIEIPSSSESPRFMHPSAVQGTPPGNYSWSGEPQRGEQFWMETTVGDPPIVRFRGAVLRYDGPWRLEISLL